MQIQSEPIGDLAILSRQLQSTGLVKRVESYFPTHHLWRGPGVGKTLECLLMYLLSENDHRMSVVESWADVRQETLGWLLDEPQFVANHMSDDRLGNLLDLLSKDQWSAFQRAHNEELIRIYELGLDQSKPLTVRIDSTTAQSDRPRTGLFQNGHNAQGLDLAQIKVMLLAMDQANLPIAMLLVEGNRVDDGLYVPVLEEAWQQGLPGQGLLIVGDTKLCHLENMLYIAKKGNYYMGPLAIRQFSHQDLVKASQWISEQEGLEQGPQSVQRTAIGSREAEEVARVKELPHRYLIDPDTGVSYLQRLIAVCPTNNRIKQLKELDDRLAKGQAALWQRFTRKQGRKTLTDVQEAKKEVDRLLLMHKVDQLLNVEIRPSADVNAPCVIDVQINDAAYQLERQVAGWRVFATNAPEEILSATDLVLCYWEEYRIEQQFHLLLNKCAALMPIFLHKENRIRALLRILMLALQYSNLLQHTIRTELAQQQQAYVTNVVPGNPGRKVQQPTTALFLQAFKNLCLIFVTLPDGTRFVHLQGLQDHHHRLLNLLRFTSDIYMHPLCQRT